jgi:hypothetical protein
VDNSYCARVTFGRNSDTGFMVLGVRGTSASARH